MTDTLFVIVTILLVDKNLNSYLYRIHNIALSHPTLKKSFHYEIDHRYFKLGHIGII